MKNRNALIFLSAIILLINTIACSSSKLIIKETYQVDGIFNVLQSQVKKAENDIKADAKYEVQLQEADAIFDNVITTSETAGLSILVFKPNYTNTKKTETTVTFSLLYVASNGPQAEVAKSSKIKFKPGQENALSNLIENAAAQFSKVIVTLPEADKYQKNFEIDIAYTIDENGTLEINAPIGIVNIGASVSADAANTHIVKVVFRLDKAKH
jgi:hypothetical protein